MTSLMVHVSGASCFRDPAIFYNALFAAQQAMGCSFGSMPANDRQFDAYVGQPYLKAMTDLADGRTLLILGRDHHATAGQGSFGTDPAVYREPSEKGFGALARWAHLGSTLASGIVLVDFVPHAGARRGVATNCSQVQTLARYATELGFPREKPVYLVADDRIAEPEEAKRVRGQGIHTIGDWVVLREENVAELERIIRLSHSRRDTDRVVTPLVGTADSANIWCSQQESAECWR